MNVSSFAVAALVLSGVLPTRGAVLFSSLGQPDQGVGLSFGSGSFASDFRTGASPAMVRGLVVRITNFDDTNDGAPGREHLLSAFIYTSVAGLPGALLETFDSIGVSKSRSLVTYFNDVAITLAPDTTYWVGIRSLTTPTWFVGGLLQGSTGTNVLTGDSIFTSVATTGVAFRSSPDGVWSPAGPIQGNLLLALYDTPVPEPAGLLGLSMGIVALSLRRHRPSQTARVSRALGGTCSPLRAGGGHSRAMQEHCFHSASTRQPPARTE